jgi:Tfp pilus assembly protein FimT
MHADGSITVRRTAGHGTVVLPADYVAEHVRLGYTATEHGNQSDTVTIGIQLVTAATTCRGLYVGATRGRAQNLMLVVTDEPIVDEARDVLERVLASDPVDVPATTQRRDLAADDHEPRTRRTIDHPRENELVYATARQRRGSTWGSDHEPQDISTANAASRISTCRPLAKSLPDPHQRYARRHHGSIARRHSLGLPPNRGGLLIVA